MIVILGINLEVGQHIAERIRKKIETSPVLYHDKHVNITTSIGGVELRCMDVFLNPDLFLIQAIEKADQNLYKAK